jgi:hypothetical protein
MFVTCVEQKFNKQKGTAMSKIFTCKTFEGCYPVGTAAIVCAKNAKQAADKLNVELKSRCLPGDALAKDMIEFPADGEEVRILCDGNY